MCQWSRLADCQGVWTVDRAAELVGLEAAEFVRALRQDLGLRPVVVAERPELGALVFGQLVAAALEGVGQASGAPFR